MALTFAPGTTFVYASGLGFVPYIPVDEGMQGVTETQAEAVLAELRPWLREQPAFDQFRRQLEMAVGRTLAIRQAIMYRRAAFSRGWPAPQVYVWSNGPTWDAANPPEWVSSMIRAYLQLQQRARKGPAPRTWYPGFVRDLAEIAEGIGIKVTTASGWTDETHATAFTRFVRAVEKLLPRKEHSPSFAACAKRIERAIASADVAALRKRKRKKPGDSRCATNRIHFLSGDGGSACSYAGDDDLQSSVPEKAHDGELRP
jgi:hypothetical protein